MIIEAAVKDNHIIEKIHYGKTVKEILDERNKRPVKLDHTDQINRLSTQVVELQRNQIRLANAIQQLILE